MTSIAAKFRLTRGKEIDLPGKPISESPLAFSQSVDLGQLVMTTDTGRVFIGHVPGVGDVNYNRTRFPYQNIEILTEASPRTKELFSDFMKSQTENDFFVPTTIPVANAEITFPDYSGNEVPSRFYATNFSAVVEYHCFILADNSPIQNGKLYIRASGGSAEIFHEGVGSAVDFTIGYNGTYYYLMCDNGAENGDVKFFMRKTVLSGLTDGELV
jgi:hypothetical protein